jgi:hypothetical protein
MKGRIAKIGVGVLAVVTPLVACNAVLNIHDTLNEDWDGGTVGSTMTSTGSTTSSGASSAYSNPLMSGDGSVPPPVDAGQVAYWADWPIPNPTLTELPHPQVYTTTTQGIAQDAVTGLQWQANVDGTLYTWNDAVIHCASLPDFGGGWRLPSRIELLSIADYTLSPAINASSFGPMPVANSAGQILFWTASLQAGNNKEAWALDFGTGVDLVFPQVRTTASYVRCVRGGT